MIKKILSIAGKPGLFRLVSQGKNMLIVEALANGKRQPVYAHEKVVSLGDISIYTNEQDIPLAEVFEKVSAKTGGQPVDVKALGSDQNIREYFGEILPNFDQDRVYTTDIKKLFSWYNTLLANDIKQFVAPKITIKDEKKVETAAEEAPKADDKAQ